jgi:hypothetical protein
MTPSNTQTLLSAHPQLFRSLREFGFECDDGWFGLLARLFADIEAQAQLEGLTRDSADWPEIVIVKQKFGTLRVSFGSGAIHSKADEAASDVMQRLVSKASELSATICEQCGAPGRSVQIHPKRPWLKTGCLACHPDPKQTPEVAPL